MRRNWLVLTTVLIAAVSARGDDWPQWRGPQRDGVWRESGVVATLPKEPRYIWRTPISEGYSGPSVARGRVYVTDRLLHQGQANPTNQFSKEKVGGLERIHCLDEKTGKVVWKHEYPCAYTISYPYGPRANPTVHQGRVYMLGAMGNFFCMDAETGKILWQKDFVKDYGTTINTWGMSAAPLIDGENVILLAGGKDDHGVVCLNKDTGNDVWHAMNYDDPGYCAPEILLIGKTKELIQWSPDSLASLDPATGKLYWKQDVHLKAGMSIPTPIFDPKAGLLFATCFYDGPLMMKVDESEPKASLLWKGKSSSEINTDGLHGVMCTPVFDDGYIYGVCSYGQLRCLDAKTGKRMWETFEATGKARWSNAFIVKHEDRYVLFNEHGDLIFAKFSPEGYKELSRTRILEPTGRAGSRKIVWTHPAFGNRRVYARNDKEIVCIDLSAN